jgi:hypothetical protein
MFVWTPATSSVLMPRLLQKAVHFLSVVRDDVFHADLDGGMLSLPRPRGLRWYHVVAAAVAVVDGQRRVGEGQRLRRLDTLHRLDALPLRCVLVEVHAVRRRVDDLHAAQSGRVHHRRDLLRQFTAALAGALAPVIVPDVAEDDRRLADFSS